MTVFLRAVKDGLAFWNGRLFWLDPAMPFRSDSFGHRVSRNR
jgi:hypothetical protein